MFFTELLDQAAIAQAEADGLKMKLKTSDDELTSANDKLDYMRSELQLANKERDNATSQLNKFRKDSDNLSYKKETSEDANGGKSNDNDFLQQQCIKLKE